ncbi:SH3 domain-containing protein [Sulfitobacter sp. BSw21498]|uniref:SH3 domain-containing protein n=1 Tax=Sulfitobacter sp. BSw21498 TaxID=664426 RepID=UPI001110EBFA|nr:SH3 domain-containing protein [Sulfitobacter sp. BSw21498]
MRKAMTAAVSALVIGTTVSATPATAGSLGRFEVSGVDGDDMLKMRAGPGTGFIVLLGLPNGTVLQVHECQQTGGTRWCDVSLDQARRVRGHVSWAYLRKLR